MNLRHYIRISGFFKYGLVQLKRKKEEIVKEEDEIKTMQIDSNKQTNKQTSPTFSSSFSTVGARRKMDQWGGRVIAYSIARSREIRCKYKK